MKNILFLHGWGGNENSFAPIKKYFQNSYNVFAPAMPCPPEDVWRLEEYVLFIENFLLQNKISKCYVVAHSFGARVVALLASKNADIFEKIVITGGAGLKPKFSFSVWWKIVWYKMKKAMFGKASGGSAEYRNLTDNGKATFRNIVNKDLSAEIAKVSVPTLLITGSQDTATPVYMAKRWAKLSQNAKYKIYQGNGHFAYLESRARFIRDVEEFFNEHSAL